MKEALKVFKKRAVANGKWQAILRICGFKIPEQLSSGNSDVGIE